MRSTTNNTHSNLRHQPCWDEIVWLEIGLVDRGPLRGVRGVAGAKADMENGNEAHQDK